MYFKSEVFTCYCERFKCELRAKSLFFGVAAKASQRACHVRSDWTKVQEIVVLLRAFVIEERAKAG